MKGEGLVLTAASVKALPCNGKRTDYDVADGPKGLKLRVHPSDKRVWIVITRVGGRLVTITHDGDARSVPPREAIAWAEGVLDKTRAGTDPRDEEDKRKAETVEAIFRQWIDDDQSANRTVAEVEHCFRRDVLPTWGKRPISTITRREATELVSGVKRRAPYYARRLHAYLHRFFRWAVGRDFIEHNPLADAIKPPPPPPRERVLNDGELADVWHATEAMVWPWRHLYQLLILSGSRLEEFAELRWSEIDIANRVILKPGRTVKRQRKDANLIHRIPISSAMLPILNELSEMPRLSREFVFSTTGITPISGFSNAKDELDALVIAARRAKGLPTMIDEEKSAKRAANVNARRALKGLAPIEVAPMCDFTPHDFRRTLSTGLLRLGFASRDAVDALTGHVVGVRAVYQRYGFERELADAAENWGAHVLGLTAGWHPPRRRVSRRVREVERHDHEWAR